MNNLGKDWKRLVAKQKRLSAREDKLCEEWNAFFKDNDFSLEQLEKMLGQIPYSYAKWMISERLVRLKYGKEV